MLEVHDLDAGGFGTPWGQSRSFSSRLSQSANVGSGFNWQPKETPYLVVQDSGTVVVMGQANHALWFDPSGNGYQPRYSIRETLQLDPVNNVYNLYHLDGSITQFNATTGVFVQHTDAAGNKIAVISYAANNFNATEVQRTYKDSSGNTTIESFLYSYVDATQAYPVLSGVLLRRRVISSSSSSSSSSGSPWTNVEQVLYTYYDGTTAFGNQNDLQTVERQMWENGAWVSLGKTLYRYWLVPGSSSSSSSSSSSGNVSPGHLLKFVVNPNAYDRLNAATGNPLTASDATVAQYADNYFEYDSSGRVTKEVVEGNTRTFLYSYTQSNNAQGYNSWALKTVETLPDGNQNIVYSNYAGQAMLMVFQSGSNQWCTFNEYSADGKIILSAMPSAVSGFSESYADLLHSVGGNYQYLNDHSGLIHTYTYHQPTGFLASESVQQGELGCSILLHQYLYVACGSSSSSFSSSSSSSGVILVVPPTYFLAEQIDYPDDPTAGSSSSSSSSSGCPMAGRQIITTFSYSFYPGTCQVQQRTTTLPVIPTSQNGNGVAATRKDYFDVYGNETYQMDERGFITRMSFDIVTGAMTQRIDDVNTSLVSDAPSGWITPAGGGLHLITDYSFDPEGRIIQVLGPSHTIDISGVATTIRRASWTVYQDGSFQVWSGQGYATGSSPNYSYTLINPVSISITDKDGKPTDSIQATRASTSGALSSSDSFAQSSYTRWTTMQYSDGFHLSSQRMYKLIPSSGTGSSGTNYDESDYGYDVMFRRNKSVTPGGTISRTVFDARSNPAQSWVGTNDNGATNNDPTGGGALGNNMVQVTLNVYDANAAGGDNNLTQQTQYVDGSTTRVTSFLYDWRDRQTDVDGEVDFYARTYYDNLDRVIKNERYNTTLSGNLIGRSLSFFDDRSRVFQTVRFAVDITTGLVGNSLTDNTWFDAAGNVLKSLPAGSSLFTKYAYDGIGRMTAQYQAFNVSETGYPNPLVTNDTVMEQAEQTYDAASNVIQTTSRQRYHNATGLGALGTPSSSQPLARVTYVAPYPDTLGRNQATADYGTNGGVTLSRSSTIPARSDTCLVSSTLFDSAGNVLSTTDPAGMVTCFSYDNVGREVQRVLNCQTSSSSSSSSGCGCPSTGDCAVSVDTGVTIQTAYNPDGNVSSITAVNADTGNQKTQYIYGTTLAESKIASSLLKRYEVLPDATGVCTNSSSSSSSGSAMVCDQIAFTYNRQGEMIGMTDQNNTVHSYLYDLLGRQTSDCITTVGTNIDSSVLRISTTYEVRGMPVNITSYNNATVGMGSVVNDVQRVYNSFAQLVTEYQSHSGAVVVGITPSCQYQYANGSANTIRPTALIYPNGRVLNYSYGVSGGMNDVLSRIGSLIDNDGATHLADYTYLGLGTIVQTYSQQPGLQSTLISLPGSNDPVTGDIYSGLDLFARVKDLIWTSNGGSSSSSSSSSSGSANIVERIQHGYDRASNRLWRGELADQARQHDEVYTYDGIHRLKRMDRGTLNGGKTGVTGEQFAQCWSLDATGNWKWFKQDNDGNGIWDLVQSRRSNQVNEIVCLDGPASQSGAMPLALPTPLGTVRPDRSSWVVPQYDAAGNMTTMPQPSNPYASFYAVWDAWNRMVTLTASGASVGQYQYDGLRRRVVKKTFSGGTTTRDFFYSAGWQDLEERVNGSSNPQRQFVWGEQYIDELVLRDRDSTGSGVLNERLFGMHDPNWNLVGVCDQYGSVQERYGYDAYGISSVLNPALLVLSASAFDQEIRYAGGRWDSESGLNSYGHRITNPILGIWMSRDPLRMSVGMNLVEYVGSNPLNRTDPSGLRSDEDLGGPAILKDMIKRGEVPPAPPPRGLGVRNGFSLCQRDWIATDYVEKLIFPIANTCCPAHVYIQYGMLNAQGRPLPGTEGWGFSGGGAGRRPMSELAFKPNSCKTVQRTSNRLKFGNGVGKTGVDATDEEIKDCISNRLTSHGYQGVPGGYHCKAWALEALLDCGLSGGEKYKLPDLKGPGPDVFIYGGAP
ncbi:hypothetical protein AYO40_00590 [Planctomycetaceae bacterium SCGC AG-212-D15]|nr:hypothetical protein AYO40_00590 [Planctomycetaceae bacterium SCGC AG-212-D15]